MCCRIIIVHVWGTFLLYLTQFRGLHAGLRGQKQSMALMPIPLCVLSIPWMSGSFCTPHSSKTLESFRWSGLRTTSPPCTAVAVLMSNRSWANCCSEVQSPVFRWKWILRIISKTKLRVQGCQTSNTVRPTCETLLSVSLMMKHPVSAARISFSARWTNLSARLFGIKL